MSNEELKNFIFVSIISADNDEYTEDEKQAILSRYNERKDDPDWAYILEPMQNKDHREKYIKLLNETN